MSVEAGKALMASHWDPSRNHLPWVRAFERIGKARGTRKKETVVLEHRDELAEVHEPLEARRRSGLYEVAVESIGHRHWVR